VIRFLSVGKRIRFSTVFQLSRSNSKTVNISIGYKKTGVIVVISRLGFVKSYYPLFPHEKKIDCIIFIFE